MECLISEKTQRFSTLLDIGLNGFSIFTDVGHLARFVLPFNWLDNVFSPFSLRFVYMYTYVQLVGEWAFYGPSWGFWTMYIWKNVFCLITHFYFHLHWTFSWSRTGAYSLKSHCCSDRKKNKWICERTDASCQTLQPGGIIDSSIRAVHSNSN